MNRKDLYVGFSGFSSTCDNLSRVHFLPKSSIVLALSNRRMDQYCL
nr:MAG TPA: U3 small nucleolar ribonucleoprotein [Caudoviricetes sp.]